MSADIALEMVLLLDYFALEDLLAFGGWAKEVLIVISHKLLHPSVT